MHFVALVFPVSCLKILPVLSLEFHSNDVQIVTALASPHGNHFVTLTCTVSCLQVLFERGLEYHPRNTKIMNAYAKFESQLGSDPKMARELHRRAMKWDTSSGTDMHHRWVGQCVGRGGGDCDRMWG